jgi:uncharacterized protein (TIGR02466 family)
MNEKYMKLWATPIAIFNHPDAEAINAELMSTEQVQKLRGMNFMSRKDAWDLIEEIPALKELHRWKLECAAKFASKCFNVEYTPEHFFHTQGSINFRKKDEEAPLHTHRLTTIVTTYYVDVHDDCGDIRLIDPRSTLGWISMEKKAYNQFTYTPQNGSMIMFPGWVTHAVLHNKTDKERVALTGNIRLKPEYEVF